ncbi:hypothetical protein LTR08_003066 [Meristemomyces frigidus]|nr:hypothetical protein LTR08_003066 [Meristemomyces frigidus]
MSAVNIFFTGLHIQDKGKRVRILAPTGKAAILTTAVPTVGGSHFMLRYEQAKRTVTIYANCDVQELGDEEPYSLLTRTQIPLHAAWAMTVHRAQGATLPSVEVNISKTFEQGQVYAALSRTPTLAGLKVLGMYRGYACGSGHPEVHEWLWENFEELREALDEGAALFEDE